MIGSIPERFETRNNSANGAGGTIHRDAVIAYVAEKLVNGERLTIESVCKGVGVSSYSIKKFIVPLFPQAFWLVRTDSPPTRRKKTTAFFSGNTEDHRQEEEEENPNHHHHHRNVVMPARVLPPPPVLLPRPPPPSPPRMSIVNSAPLRVPPRDLSQDTQDLWEAVLGDGSHTLGLLATDPPPTGTTLFPENDPFLYYQYNPTL